MKTTGYSHLAVNMSTPTNVTIYSQIQSAPFLQFQRAKNQMQVRFTVMSWILENERAAVRAVRTTQNNNLLFYLLFIILYNIYNLLFIRLAIITHN